MLTRDQLVQHAHAKALELDALTKGDRDAIKAQRPGVLSYEQNGQLVRVTLTPEQLAAVLGSLP